MKRILVLDTETGGLDAGAHSLLSIGALVWEPPKIVGEIELFVREDEILYQEEAMTVNRLDIRWLQKHGLGPVEAVNKLEEFVAAYFLHSESGARVSIAGHNVAFDVAFLRRLYRLAGRNYEKVFSHRLLDTASIIQFLALAGKIPLGEASSDEAFRYFGIAIPNQQRHTALADARATVELLNALLQMVK